MSHYDYEVAKKLREQDPPFASLIMAAVMKADSSNARKLALTFPDIVSEVQRRYDAPGGVIQEDRD